MMIMLNIPGAQHTSCRSIHIVYVCRDEREETREKRRERRDEREETREKRREKREET